MSGEGDPRPDQVDRLVAAYKAEDEALAALGEDDESPENWARLRPAMAITDAAERSSNPAEIEAAEDRTGGWRSPRIRSVRLWADRADAWLERHPVLCLLIAIARLAAAVLAAIAFGRPGPG